MRRILATTAIVAFSAVPVAADMQSMSGDKASYVSQDGMEILAADLIGKTVYMTRGSEAETGWATDLTDAPDTWENVADVTDVLISDGRVASVILDAGGFLGIGEKEVSIDVKNLRMVPDTDDAGEFFAVYTGTKDLLEDAEPFDAIAAEQEGYSVASILEDTTYGSGDIVNDEKMTSVLSSEVTTEQLEGIRVYGSTDEWVGDVDEMIVSSDGMIDKVVVDVGGFLGIGEKEVALDFDTLRFMRDQDVGSLIARVDMTENQLKDMKSWGGV